MLRIAPILLVILWGFALPATTVVAEEKKPATYMVIVHVDSKVTALTKREVSNLFLRKQTRWRHNQKAARPVDQVATSNAREAFTLDIHGVSVAQSLDSSNSAGCRRSTGLRIRKTSRERRDRRKRQRRGS